MTQEQYFWNRHQQILRAYNLQQQKAAGGTHKAFHERQLLSNLKEVWFEDFDEQFDIIPDDKTASFTRSNYGACSSVRRGNFHGRNFDFTFDPRTTHVVHVKANEEKSRHAFAGIAKASFNDDVPDMMKIPNLLKDGINDHNVVVNINVVSKKDLDDVGLNNTETNPGKKRVHCDCVPSYILAYADSAADAIDIMKNNIDIYGYLKGASEEANEYLHYMISDPNNTFVVEIIGNELFVIGYDFNEDNAKVNDIVNQFKVDPIEFPYPIMTNWYLNYGSLPPAAIKADGKYTQYGCGIERFKVLNDNYDSAESVFELMKLARYKNACEKRPEDENFPFSDLIGRSTVQDGRVVDYYDYLNFRYGDIVLKDFIDNEQLKMKDAFANNKRNLGVWLTSHNTVYDIANKTFTLVFEEDYDNVMNFAL